ncbi:hypothetical protein K466DRAFT_273638 [Polyporus arcularius HHB13444]|uniref:Uncharacterized protein n=1 Tax=Polyporus arcularius HHB13444 TaxID=1314778 RepID=A0A5C3P0C6_9APHY|nr:hypothetical protein K466DRAFT_273638 [Polyporus arcularius HHB13444]
MHGQLHFMVSTVFRRQTSSQLSQVLVPHLGSAIRDGVFPVDTCVHCSKARPRPEAEIGRFRETGSKSDAGGACAEDLQDRALRRYAGVSARPVIHTLPSTAGARDHGLGNRLGTGATEQAVGAPGAGECFLILYTWGRRITRVRRSVCRYVFASEAVRASSPACTGPYRARLRRVAHELAIALRVSSFVRRRSLSLIDGRCSITTVSSRPHPRC